jgi:hypothetical protein
MIHHRLLAPTPAFDLRRVGSQRRATERRLWKGRTESGAGCLNRRGARHSIPFFARTSVLLPPIRHRRTGTVSRQDREGTEVARRLTRVQYKYKRCVTTIEHVPFHTVIVSDSACFDEAPHTSAPERVRDHLLQVSQGLYLPRKVYSALELAISKRVGYDAMTMKRCLHDFFLIWRFDSRRR